MPLLCAATVDRSSSPKHGILHNLYLLWVALHAKSVLAVSA